MPAWRSAVTSPWTALTSRPTRRATSRIDNAPWPVIALRISQRFLVKVFQSRSTESNEMCAPCSSPRNAAAARRETSSREAIERVTTFIPVSIDRRPARNRPEARRRRTKISFWAEIDERYLCNELLSGPCRLARPPPFGPVRAGRRRLRGRSHPAGDASQLARDPGASAENARDESRDIEVDVQLWPVQIQSGAVDFDIGQVLLARALKILHALRRKSVSAAIGQLDDHAAGGGIVMRGGGPRLCLDHFAAARFSPLQLLLVQISHGSAPSPSRTRLGARPLRRTAASDPTA